MILVDTVLKKRESENNPIKVGIIGVGVMGKGIINQIVRYTPGVEIVAVYNRTLQKAIDAFQSVEIEDYVVVETVSDYKKQRSLSKIAITQNIDVLCEAYDVDLLIEVTGTISFATETILKAFNFGKNVLSFNAEIETTFGPILKYKAKKAGVMYSVADGDQPGVTLNLFRQVELMGFKPLICGNIKGMQDRYRNPTTQKEFAGKWNMTPEMVTSFADGTKISIEQACIANATGMKVAQRGMLGYSSDKHIDHLKDLYDIEKIKELGGVVEYVIGAKPGPGVFIYATINDQFSKKYLSYMKLGKGPLYSFYVPYHLLFFEIASSISKMIDFHDTILSCKKGLYVDVIAQAKINLNKGDVIDGIGGYKAYGVCENHTITNTEDLIPVGLMDGLKLNKDIAMDQPIRFSDIENFGNRFIDQLWLDQKRIFG